MRNKFLASILFLSLLAALCVGTAFAEEAAPTSDSLICDGVPQTPTVYKINGSNYFKIRDLAAILNGTDKQFSVGYDGEKQSVTADTGAGYEKQPTDLTGAPAGGSKTASPSGDAIYINGVLCQAEVYKIDGMNYFKLRDLGQALDFGVGWDGATGTVTLDTSRGYETQTPPAQSVSDQELMEMARQAADNIDKMNYKLETGSLLPLDTEDIVTTVDSLYGIELEASRVIGCSTIAEAEAKMREVWYQTFSRKYSTFNTEQLCWIERDGKVYVAQRGGRGSIPGNAEIDRIVSRTADEVIFSGHYGYYSENVYEYLSSFELSLVFEDGIWKYGYCKSIQD